jgi:hypothetical protein
MKTVLLMLTVAGLIVGTPVMAQSVDVEALKKKLTERGDQYAQLKEILEEADPEGALAAFDVMVESGNKSLYEIAVSSALSATDTRLRARALWEAISRRDHLIIEVDTEAIKNQDEANKTLNEWHGAQQAWPLHERFLDTQCINLHRSKRCYIGRQVTVSGIKLDFTYTGEISDTFVLQPSGELVGTIVNPRLQSIIYPARIVFR